MHFRQPPRGNTIPRGDGTLLLSQRVSQSCYYETAHQLNVQRHQRLSSPETGGLTKLAVVDCHLRKTARSAEKEGKNPLSASRCRR